MERCIKILFSILLIVFNLKSYGQFKSVSIGIDGLTCSMCSNNVEKLLRQLKFIDNVAMNLNDHTALITFASDEKIEIYKIAQKVIDAGYSLRFLKAIYHFNNLNTTTNPTFQFQNDSYSFVNCNKTILNGDHEIQFLGKKYLSKKELQKWSSFIPSNKSKSNPTSYYITC